MKQPINFGVITVSDRIYEGKAEDVSGKGIVIQLIKNLNGKTVFYTVVPNRRLAIEKAIEEAISRNADVIFLIGGTGFSPRDISTNIVNEISEKHIPGFGELFRYLTFVKEGTKAWLSRATAGIYKGKLIFAIPGSPSAVKLALKEIILPEIHHAIKMIKGISHWDEYEENH